MWASACQQGIRATGWPAQAPRIKLQGWEESNCRGWELNRDSPGAVGRMAVLKGLKPAAGRRSTGGSTAPAERKERK